MLAGPHRARSHSAAARLARAAGAADIQAGIKEHQLGSKLLSLSPTSNF